MNFLGTPSVGVRTVPSWVSEKACGSFVNYAVLPMRKFEIFFILFQPPATYVETKKKWSQSLLTWRYYVYFFPNDVGCWNLYVRLISYKNKNQKKPSNSYNVTFSLVNVGKSLSNIFLSCFLCYNGKKMIHSIHLHNPQNILCIIFVSVFCWAMRRGIGKGYKQIYKLTYL